jgi:hypothetical protein
VGVGGAERNKNPQLTMVARKYFLVKARKQKKKGGSGSERRGQGSVRVARCTGTRTYLLAASATGVGLGVRRRAAAAPGRGVKVPGIILEHDPRWGPERKQGVFLPPPSPRPRTGCCALARPPAAPRALVFAPGLFPHDGGRGQGGGDTRKVSPERLARHFFPALQVPRDQ